MEAVAAWMRAASEDAGELYASWGLAQGNVELALDAAERAASWVLPSVPVAYLVVVLFWIRPRLPLLGLPVPVAPFEAYRNDEWLAAFFVLAGAGTLLFDGTSRWVAINLLVTVLILYFVQGLAMIRAPRSALPTASTRSGPRLTTMEERNEGDSQRLHRAPRRAGRLGGGEARIRQ
jgi:hypothetical protein